MGLFNTNFEATVNHPQEEIFKNFCKYIKQDGGLSLSSSSRFSKINFTKGTTLFSYAIDFEIELKKTKENQTILMVKSSSDTIDLGKSKGLINDILQEIYGEELECVELENSSYKSWRKTAIIVSAILIGVTLLLQTSLNESANYEYNEVNTSTVAVENTDIEPWMVGEWKGSSYVTDWNNNTVKVLINLEIDEYGNATQFMQMQGGSPEVEQFTLKYDRSSQVLYYREGGLRITYKVNPSSHTISSGDNITLYKKY